MVRCLQSNLGHCTFASSSLSQVILDINLDIILIQETYALTGYPPVLANVPADYSAFHDHSSYHAYGFAIIVLNSIA